MAKQIGMALGGLVLLAASSASAHIEIKSHKSRHDSSQQKAGPCGAPTTARGAMVYTYQPGETIKVVIDEFVPHPGWFRISFDEDGVDDFMPPASIDPPEYYVNDAVLMDELDPHTSGGGERSFDVTLPDVECDNCTLQVIQVMLDKPPYDPQDTGAFSNDIYYACIDLELKRSATSPAAGTDPAQGTDGAATADAGDATPAAGSDTSVGAAGAAAPADMTGQSAEPADGAATDTTAAMAMAMAADGAASDAATENAPAATGAPAPAPGAAASTAAPMTPTASPADTGSTNNTATAVGEPTTPASDERGCSVASPGRTGHTGAAAWGLITAVGLVTWRRRARTPR